MTKLHHFEHLETLVMKLGFLPFFQNEIPGFSVEDCTPRKLWFSGEYDGPWEWKGPVIRNGNCAYGKLFNKKAGFVSLDWFPDFANYRRSAYPLISSTNSDQDQPRETIIYNTIVEHDSLLTNDLKTLLGYNKQRKKPSILPAFSEQPTEKAKQGFDSAMTRLQMGTWIVVADFEYRYNKQLERYGWGIARFTTPEALFGGNIALECEGRSPEESKNKIVDYLKGLLPGTTEEEILRIIG